MHPPRFIIRALILAVAVAGLTCAAVAWFYTHVRIVSVDANGTSVFPPGN
jgi:hypothetical protein